MFVSVRRINRHVFFLFFIIMVKYIYIFIYYFFFFTESLGTYTLFVYDLDALEPAEIVQKAVLQLERNANDRIEKAINVSFYVSPKKTVSQTYLGTASIQGTLDLAGALGSKLLTGVDQLVVRIEAPVKPSIGLVLYSVTTGGRFDSGHELSKLLLDAKTNRRRRRSVADNEIEQNNFPVDLKRKKKKKKGSRVSKLQVMIVIIIIINIVKCIGIFFGKNDVTDFLTDYSIEISLYIYFFLFNNEYFTLRFKKNYYAV